MDDSVEKLPQPPPKTASKKDKLKYLEDLENNLKQTKEKIHKEKEKEALLSGEKRMKAEEAAAKMRHVAQKTLEEDASDAAKDVMERFQQNG